MKTVWYRPGCFTDKLLCIGKSLDTPETGDNDQDYFLEHLCIIWKTLLIWVSLSTCIQAVGIRQQILEP